MRGVPVAAPIGGSAMGVAAGAGAERRHGRVPWGDVVVSALAAVSWALIGMAGTAALGLRLLEADAAGSLGPMTAAVVALAAGGSVTPSGDVSAFGLSGAEADTAIRITPLGVSLVGAVLLSWFFLRSLRAAGAGIAPAELLARAGAVAVLFVAMLGGLAWAGHDVITIDGGSLGLVDANGGDTGLSVPGLGDVGGLLPDRLGDLVDARASVGFTVDIAPTLLGGFVWVAGTLTVALLASRRTPLPPGWEALHRVVRPAVSALVTVLLVAVAAGLAAAAYAAAGDDRPGRIAGAALLGAPNGVWLGVPVGLFVPWDGRATGELTRFLPHPLDDLLGAGPDRPVTLGRLAELDGRVWLLGVGAALLMLLAGVLTGARTPVGAERSGVGFLGADASVAGARQDSGALRFVGRCAVRLGGATALALPLLVRLTDVSVTASLSVLGFDAFGAGLTLHGHLGTAVLLGALWGAGAGAAGAGLAWVCGAAGRSAAGPGRGEGLGSGGAGPGSGARDTGNRQPRRGSGASEREREAANWQASAGSGASEREREAANWQASAGSGAAEPWHSAPTWRSGPGDTADAPRPDEETRRVRPHGGPSRPGRAAESGQDVPPWPGGPPAPPLSTPGAPRPDEQTQQVRPHGGPSEPGRAAESGQDVAPWPGRPPAPPLSTPDAPRPDEQTQHVRPHGGPSEPGRAAESGQDVAPWPGGPPAPPLSTPGAPRPDEAGPYAPGVPYRPPNPATNPYLRVPDELRAPEDARPDQPHRPDDAPPGDDPAAPGHDPAAQGGPAAPDDDGIHGAPTVVRPVGPPPRGPRRPPGPRNGAGPPTRPDDGAPPPPPPPPPPRGPCGGGR